MKLLINDIEKIYANLDKFENSYFNNKKILLLGSDGFIGRYFTEYFSLLLKKNFNFEVDCVDNHISSYKQKNNSHHKNIKFYNQDILKFEKKKKYDLIIFLAGIAGPTIYKKFPIQTLEVSFLGTKKFLEKSKKDKSLFVFFSSSEIYGNPNLQNIPTDENYYGNVNSFGPRSCYDEGKRIGETLCYVYKNYHNTKIKIIRPFNVYGPGMSKSDDRVIPSFFRLINKNRPLTIYNHGKQTRSFCYIDDALSGFIKVISKGVMGEIYNVGNDKEEISMNDLAKLLKEVAKDKKINIKKQGYPTRYPENEPMRRCPKLNKLIKDTGYKPTSTLKKSLLHFYKNYN